MKHKKILILVSAFVVVIGVCLGWSNAIQKKKAVIADYENQIKEYELSVHDA